MTTLAAVDMKQLRAQRQESISRARDAIKQHNGIIKSIRNALSAGDDKGMTIPELAKTIALESQQVLFYISTLKKYGQISEGAKDGDYFRYQLIPTND